jgi:hypothetical protein
MIGRALFHMFVFGAGVLTACLGIADMLWRIGATDPERMMHPVLNDNVNVTPAALLMVFSGFYCAMRGLEKMFNEMTNKP